LKVSILFLIDRLALGGTEGQLKILIQGLDRQRFQPHLGTFNPDNHDDAGVATPHLYLPFSALYSPSLIRCLKKLIKYIRSNDIHIVHTFFQDPTVLAALSRPLHSCKMVGSFRDLGFWRNRQESFKMRLAYPFFDGFIANSHAVKDNFVRFDHIPPEKITVIHNGISQETITSPLPSLDKHDLPPLVGIVANFNREVKRVDDFILAASIVRQTNPNTRFIVVGEGSLRSRLEKLSQSLGLSELLTFTGQLKDPISIISQLSVGVNTSETEGFSNAILEYMACGVPVVATNNSGNAELVRDGTNGFLVPIGNVEQMAERISFILCNKELQQTMRSNNLQRVQTEFTVDNMIIAHETFYKNLLAST